MTSRRAKRQSRRPAKLAAERVKVDFVNSRYVIVRTDNGENIRLSDLDGYDALPGDQIFVEPVRSRRSEKSPLKVIGIKRASEHLVAARFSQQQSGSSSECYLEPIGLRSAGLCYLRPDQVSDQDCIEGDYVLAVVQPESKTKERTQWRLKKILRLLDSPRALARAVAQARHGISETVPNEVSCEIEAGVKQINRSADRARKDLRHLPFVTIDPKGAKDHDDAIYCERVGSRSRLYVAIADVAEWVTSDSAIDRFARKRGFSVYFSESAIPMLPDKLSSEACSLVPNEDRFALVCEMMVDSNGAISSSAFYEATIRSAARLTYAQADHLLKLNAPSKLQHDLQNLAQIYARLRSKRHDKGALVLNIFEPSLRFDADGAVTDVRKSQPGEMHGLVEEAMLAANVCAAEFICKRYPDAGMFRVHASPSPDDADRLCGVLSGFGIGFPSDRSPGLDDYLKASEELAKLPEVAGAMQHQLLRSLSVAVYSEAPAPHFALNFDRYAHFTSPIRRYPDLIVHRMIKNALRNGKPAYRKKELAETARFSSYLERKAEACMREATRWLIVEYMATRVGEVFSGAITEVKEFGVFVQLDKPYVDGLVAVRTLGNEYYDYNDRYKTLVGRKSGKTLAIGSPMEVRVVDANQELGFIDFEPAQAPARRPHRQRRRRR